LTARRETADHRRRQLVAATIGSIARHGLDGCSIKAITKSAGVSRGLIHHYFRNKDELLCAAYSALGGRMMQVLRRIAAEERTPVGRLDAVIRGAFIPPVSSATNMSAWLGFWHASRNNPRLRAINREIYSDYRGLLTTLVSEAARELDSEVDATEVVSTLVSLADGAWIQMAIDSDSDASEASSLAYVHMVMGR
jgi:TetR/AcrR family transcriptional repressor of bet genes